VRQCGATGETVRRHWWSTRVSTLGDDVAHGWDPAACAAGCDGDGIMLVSAMAERAPGQSLPAFAGAFPLSIPRCSALLSPFSHHILF